MESLYRCKTPIGPDLHNWQKGIYSSHRYSVAELKEMEDVFILSDLGFNDARGRTLYRAGLHNLHKVICLYHWCRDQKI